MKHLEALADALELGLLQNHAVVLSQPVIGQLKDATPKGVPDGLLPMPPKTIYESKEAYGICKFRMTL